MQSLEVRHCTQALPPAPSLHTAVGGLQSRAWVAAVQTGTQALPAQRKPFPHCALLVQATQAPVAGLQCDAAGSDEQSPSLTHRLEAQVFCAVQVSPPPQPWGGDERQATQVRVSVRQ